jgi:vacuole morphology and inheritance protein 14
MLLPQSSAFAALKNRLNSVSAIGFLHIAPRVYVPPSRQNSSSDFLPRQAGLSNTTARASDLLFPTLSASASAFKTLRQQHSSSSDTHSSSSSAPTTTGPSNFDRSSRLKGREEGIKWNELLEKFKNVQERARKAHRHGGDLDDGFDARAADGLDARAFKEFARLPPVPVVPVKDTLVMPVQQPQASKSKTSLGKFGRLAGGRQKR